MTMGRPKKYEAYTVIPFACEKSTRIYLESLVESKEIPSINELLRDLIFEKFPEELRVVKMAKIAEQNYLEAKNQEERFFQEREQKARALEQAKASKEQEKALYSEYNDLLEENRELMNSCSKTAKAKFPKASREMLMQFSINEFKKAKP